jgi:hypothetical protein
MLYPQYTQVFIPWHRANASLDFEGVGTKCVHACCGHMANHRRFFCKITGFANYAVCHCCAVLLWYLTSWCLNRVCDVCFCCFFYTFVTFTDLCIFLTFIELCFSQLVSWHLHSHVPTFAWGPYIVCLRICNQLLYFGMLLCLWYVFGTWLVRYWHVLGTLLVCCCDITEGNTHRETLYDWPFKCQLLSFCV